VDKSKKKKKKKKKEEGAWSVKKKMQMTPEPRKVVSGLQAVSR
jgi:hypothetical protein